MECILKDPRKKLQRVSVVSPLPLLIWQGSFNRLSLSSCSKCYYTPHVALWNQLKKTLIDFGATFQKGYFGLDFFIREVSSHFYRLWLPVKLHIKDFAPFEPYHFFDAPVQDLVTRIWCLFDSQVNSHKLPMKPNRVFLFFWLIFHLQEWRFTFIARINLKNYFLLIEVALVI